MQYTLKEHYRNVPDEELITDVTKTALRLGKSTLTIEDYEKYGNFCSTTLRRRFGSWKNILIMANLDVTRRNFQISNDEYIDDVKRVAKILQKNTVTNTEYRKLGKYDASKLSLRFGCWNKVLEAANLLSTGHNKKISDAELLEEIEQLWAKLGRQPTTTDVRNGYSKYGLTTFLRHFGSWKNTLITFVQHIDLEDSKGKQDLISPINIPKTNIISQKHKTNRDVNYRLRFLVMKRDNFKCCMCGASPATNPSTELHIDHIIPWSKGGETTFDNLQTLCSKCNLGKSNLM